MRSSCTSRIDFNAIPIPAKAHWRITSPSSAKLLGTTVITLCCSFSWKCQVFISSLLRTMAKQSCCARSCGVFGIPLRAK
ncbi:Uncharacterised protein [Vibrio cholerae]|nr:Uncharacterised protein [Vibrio cholerae]